MLKRFALGSVFKKAISLSIYVHVFVFSIISALIILGLLLSGIFTEDNGIYDYHTTYGDPDITSKLLTINVNGIILGDTSEYPSALPFLEESVTFGYEVKKELIRAAEDPDIAGVILEINSPGGTIYGSRAIADAVLEYKEATGNPVHAHVAGLAASGGYMAAVTADTISADYGSTTGSIGVIFGPIKYYDTVISEGGLLQGEVVTENGIESTYITAGESKDIGNPYRRLTPEELTILQSMVNNEYEGFVNYVSTHREISEQDLRRDIGALIYDNRTAQSLRLIDTTQNKHEAYKALAESAQIDEYRVIEKSISYGFTEILLGSNLFSGRYKSSCLSVDGILAYHGDLSAICSGAYSR